MRSESRTYTSFLFLILLGCSAAPVAAQGLLPDPGSPAAFSGQRTLGDYAVALEAGEMSELVSYLRPGETSRGRPAPKPFLRNAPAEKPSRLILFTRLAGMFMGRVSPFSVGGMLICLKLDLR